MLDFNKPKKHDLGWFVAENTQEGFFADYLHPCGNVYPSTNGVDGKEHSGFFATEAEGYEAIRKYYTSRLDN